MILVNGCDKRPENGKHYKVILLTLCSSYKNGYLDYRKVL